LQILYQKLKEYKSVLNDFFKIKDLGKLKYFISLEVTRSKKEIHPCQKKDILKEVGILASKPCSTPFMSNNKVLYEVVNL